MVECPVCTQMQRRYLSTKHLASLAGMKPESVANALQRIGLISTQRLGRWPTRRRTRARLPSALNQTHLH
jgi:hypothetical protein